MVISDSVPVGDTLTLRQAEISLSANLDVNVRPLWETYTAGIGFSSKKKAKMCHVQTGARFRPQQPTSIALNDRPEGPLNMDMPYFLSIFILPLLIP